jgi:hypothetical protein
MVEDTGQAHGEPDHPENGPGREAEERPVPYANEKLRPKNLGTEEDPPSTDDVG